MILIKKKNQFCNSNNSFRIEIYTHFFFFFFFMLQFMAFVGNIYFIFVTLKKNFPFTIRQFGGVGMNSLEIKQVQCHKWPWYLLIESILTIVYIN